MDLSTVAGLAIAGLAGWLTYRAATTGYRYYKATPQQRLRIRHAWWVRRRWNKLSANVGLVRIDENTKGRKGMNGKAVKPTTVRPRIKVIPEPYGLRVIVRTIAGVGQAEFERAAQWLADAWICDSVEVHRVTPGTLELRCLVGNPLDERREYDWPQAGDWRLPIGHNPWGRQISVPLRQLSGIKVAGLPGYGKTFLMLGWLASLAHAGGPLVQFALFDGKSSDPRYGDWGEVGQRALFLVGDNPETAHQRLTELVRLVKDRPGRLVAERGHPQFWKQGPTFENPLVLVLMDECHNYVDSSGLRGKEKELIESNQRLMRVLAKEGRGLGVIPVLATQKQTGDAIPTAVRDNLEVGISFACFTLEGAEAALGSGIRKDEPNWPTALVDKDRNVGVCVVTGVPGLDGQYDRVRVGDIEEDLVLEVVGSSFGDRREIIPAEGPTLRKVTDEPSQSTTGSAAPAGASDPQPKAPPKPRRASRKTAADNDQDDRKAG
ncbi:hypothetical protein ACH427_32255 [Streptomyces sp. NPDC020379]|uniref:hypothetical protein n=1 Tax=Streptomyces sp. NPDC020379 TaxID=3365071 RepID=UPI0037BB29B2